ncbi:MAG: type II toxin-antitoxin system RelE/ParE family toxin [Prevotellaceae bacterium]|jgi:proteic killer suppression protein|nr:type II toxin-antitoxin system RelE/ParE family toxin [Prevotellaceae bacterium]
MIVTFDKDYLRDLYETGKTTDKKHRFQPEIVRKYKYCIHSLVSASDIASICRIKSFNYEELQGDKKGISSIRVNLQYRIEFIVEHLNLEPIITVCNIMELSKHYK